MTFSTVTKRSLVESVVDQIRQALQDGRWKVGARIPTEPELAELFKISRNTVREAVRVLIFAGLLEARQGDGTYVRSLTDPTETLKALSQGTLIEHLEARAILEVEATRLAALRRTEDDLVQMRNAFHASAKCLAANDLEGFVEHDLAFHASVVRAARNGAMTELYSFFSRAIRQHLRALVTDERLPMPCIEDHGAVLEAIERQHPDEAAEASRRIVCTPQEVLEQLASSTEGTEAL